MIELTSLNVNGLRTHRKLKQLKALLNSRNFDITFVQETHYVSAVDNWQEKFKGKSFWSGNSNVSAGVAIIFNEKIDPKIIKKQIDNNGRYIILSAELEKKKYTFVNVYCPDNPTARSIFLKDFVKTLEDFDIEENLVMGGDFNFVFNTEKERRGGPQAAYQRKGAKILGPFLENNLLVDAWLESHPDKPDAFTWSNKKGTIKSRIDKFYISDNLEIKSAQLYAVHFTDHKALCISILNDSKTRGTGYWKLNTNILTHPQYINKIENLWNLWKHKKDKMNIKRWWDLGKLKISEESIEYSKLMHRQHRRRVNNTQKKLNKLCQDREKNLSEIKETEDKLFCLCDDGAMGAAIRSKQRLAEQLEEPSAYFYQAEKIKKKKTEIEIDENIVYKHFQTRFEFNQFDLETAKKVLSSTSAKICESKNEKLEAKITKRELQKALSNTENNKSPGLDGIPYEFYRVFWDILGDDLTEVLNYCLETGALTDTQRKAVLSLLPKKGDLKDPKNWRPISLLNCDLKLLTKSLAARLVDVLPEIINDSQVCAIKGRQIHHHTTLIRNMITYAKQKKIPLYIVSFDQAKAFDQVSWDYMFLVLYHFGFPPTFVRYIETIYNGVQTTININGHLTPYFFVKRGVRQGCPLSLLLYIMVIETLNNHIQKNELVKGFSVSDKTVKTLFYSDDATCVLKDIQELKIVLEAFDDYCKASCAKLNLDKTIGIRVNAKDSDKPPIEINWNSPNNKILGIYFTPDYTSDMNKNWNEVEQKIKKQVDILSSRKLSLKGKALIANTLLLSKAWYVGRVFMPNKKITAKIMKLICAYIWKNKHEVVSRSDIIKPLKDGGLALLGLEQQCLALQVKDVCPDTESLANNMANAWFEGGNGPIPTYYKLIEKRLNEIDLKKEDFNGKTVKQIRTVIQKEQKKLKATHDAQATLNAQTRAFIDWEDLRRQNYNTFGSLKAANTFFLFQYNSLAVLKNVERWYRGKVKDVICPLCNKREETQIHLFKCDVWKPVWEKLIEMLQEMNSDVYLVEELVHCQEPKNRKVLNTFVFQAMHEIYKARNSFVFENKLIDAKIILERILENTKKFLTLRFTRYGPAFLKHFNGFILSSAGTLEFRF